MPLSIPLPVGAKIVVNGAAIENGGPGDVSLLIHNKANMLRDGDILPPEAANTPARQIYHSLQNAYLFEGKREEWLEISLARLARFRVTAPGAADFVDFILRLIDEGRLYHALRGSRRLIAFEDGDIP